jgi:hypothetical protein
METDEHLTQEFADAVVEQAREISLGNARSGNSHARRYVSAARVLLGRGHDGTESFATLLSHSDASVRAMAAAFLLETRTELALAALRRIAAGVGLAALGARMTLQRYERGDLRIE